MNRPLPLIAGLLGVLFLAIAAMCWFVPASGLPSFIRGFKADSAHIYVKHAIGSLIMRSSCSPSLGSKAGAGREALAYSLCPRRVASWGGVGGDFDRLTITSSNCSRMSLGDPAARGIT
jgi:hypothetical protein